MVEKAGTGDTGLPEVVVDTDYMAQAALYASKPDLPEPCVQEQHEQYVGALCAWYVKQLDLDKWRKAEQALALFRQCYTDGWTNREFTF